mmetsp:Transcript_33817/g.41480  ORF Transcript_33817/g.41480 Transcript_33817/m.41480 type:complete len:173 (+) Transcript_33817:178-696(+)
MRGFYKPDVVDGVEYYRGNCTLPNQCTCLCKGYYDYEMCRTYGGRYCDTPFHDPLFRFRNVLAPNEIFGTRDCYSGYEGLVNERDGYGSCHLTIYEPDNFTRHSVDYIVWGVIVLVFGSSTYIYVRRKMHRRYIQAKIESRKARRKDARGSGFSAFSHMSARGSGREGLKEE